MRLRRSPSARLARPLLAGLASLALARGAAAAPLDILDAEQNFLLLDGARAVAVSPDGAHVYVCAQTAST